MKKFFFLATAAIGMMVGCQTQEQTTPVDESTPMAVVFGVNSPVATVSTKAGVDAWTGQKLYIFGYERETSAFDGEAFIENVEVTVDNTTLEQDVTPKHMVNSVEESFFYASDNTTYDFYGYYVDDAAKPVYTDDNGDPATEVVASAERVYIPVTIDGTQDLMIAKASQIEDVKGTAVEPYRAYSAYSARKGIKPVLNFEHQLARFHFYVVAGSESTVVDDKATPETTDDEGLVVTGINILEAKVNADLNIVGKTRGLVDNANTATTTTLSLKEADGADLTATGPAQWFADKTERMKKENMTKIGESVMVIPGETEYKMAFSLDQLGVETAIDPTEVTLDYTQFGDEAVADGAFVAGKQYDVILTVYGLEEIVITAKLSKWEDGGSFGYDPDDEWAEPTIPTTGSLYVHDDLTWAKLPKSYRESNPWDDATYDTLPYLAVWYPAIETGASVVVTVENTALPYTKEVYNTTYVGTTAPETVITINKEELGTEIVAGSWVVTTTVNGAVLGTETIVVE